MPVSIRAARPEDAPRLLEIYAPYVAKTAVTFEYEIPTAEEFQGRLVHILERYPYLVALEDGKAKGYAYLSAFHPRAAYRWCAETSIYLDMQARGKGLGRMLYRELERIAAAQGILNLNACIAYTEEEDAYLDSQSKAFHECMGYRLCGHFHQCGHKFGRWYDMIWMEKPIGSHRQAPNPVIPFPELKEAASCGTATFSLPALPR